jgi:D-alanyl-D-alanine carboxypeptidase (penicillin-binding protein 5/6)
MYKKILIGITILATIVIIAPHRIGPQQVADPNAISAATANISQVHNQAGGRKMPKPKANTGMPNLSAKSYMAVDVATGTELVTKNTDEKLPIASLTKLMTAMVVLDHVNRDQIVTIEKSDTEVDCACMGLVEGEKISVGNLLEGMLIPSNNDAAQALARFVGGSKEEFVKLMNDKAQVLKLKQTNFSNPAGLDSTENYSTAHDLSIITQEFLKYALLERIVATAGLDVSSVDGQIVHKLKTSNKLLLTNSDVVGVKTGFTTGAQGNLILKIDENGIEVLTIVLNTPIREDDTQKLIDWVFQSYDWK